MRKLGIKPDIEWCGLRDTDPKPILYFSGHYVDEALYNKVVPVTHRCISYWSYLYRGFKEKDFERLFNRGVGVFLDSGAFTVQQQNTSWESIQWLVEGYCEFLDRYRTRLDWYATMDWQRDAASTLHATKHMQRRGYKPVAVYHGNDSIKYLEAYCDLGCPLVAIAKPWKCQGAKTFSSGTDLRRFYDGVFNLAARYNTKLHGLAQTGGLMFEYPWYSVDSTSWLVGQRRGYLLLPDTKNGKVISMQMEPKTVAQLKAGANPKPDNWEEIPKEVRDRFGAKAKELKITWKELWENYLHRNAFNMQAFQQYVNQKAHQQPRYSYRATLL